VRSGAGERLVADSRIPKRYQHCTFSNYVVYNEQLEKALEYCSRLRSGFPWSRRGCCSRGCPA
jgi:hypothetical protein